MNRIYLDHSATTPLRPEVFDAMEPWLRGCPANATSTHSYGRDAREAIEQAREQVAALLGAQPREIVFTSGGTESNNAAVWGHYEAVQSAQGIGRKHIVCSAAEHHAVLHAVDALVARRGAVSTRVMPDAQGRVSAGAVRAAITPETALVCLMHANNETGVCQAVDEVAAACHDAGVPLHTDAVQSAGKIPIDVAATPVASLALSAHKIYGPQGVGALFLRRGTSAEPLIVGGAQERGRRAGTENTAGIVGFGVAAACARAEMKEEAVRLAALRNALEQVVCTAIRGVVINGGEAVRLPHIANLAFDGIEGETLMQVLDLEGIAVSTGAACTSGSVEASHVLMAMGQSHARARSAVRVSLGRSTTATELDALRDALVRGVQRLRRARPLTPSE